ncbi:MAG: DNA-primase RepB domain-containing protein [Stellaceae bacterium]
MGRTLALTPNYVLETSAGRFQAFYLFDKPEAPEDVKRVAERLKAFAKSDHGTMDVSHVWRVPGALNWPNAKKVAEGRARARNSCVSLNLTTVGSRFSR